MNTKITIIFQFIVPYSYAIYLTILSERTDYDKIFTLAKEKGRSYAHIMKLYNDQSKQKLCKAVLNSSHLSSTNISYLEKKENPQTSSIIKENARFLYESNYRDTIIIEKSLMPHPKAVYPGTERTVLVNGQEIQLFTFPCLVTIDDVINEIHIGDAYLERTFTLLTRIFDDQTLELKNLKIIGFVELPPLKGTFQSHMDLEELYTKAFIATMYKILEGAGGSLNYIYTELSNREKQKLCEMSAEVLYNLDANTQCSVSVLEGQIMKFKELHNIWPEQKINVIKCSLIGGLDTNFYLTSNSANPDGVFVLEYDQILDGDAVSEIVRMINNEPLVLSGYLKNFPFILNRLKGVYVDIFQDDLVAAGSA